MGNNGQQLMGCLPLGSTKVRVAGLNQWAKSVQWNGVAGNAWCQGMVPDRTPARQACRKVPDGARGDLPLMTGGGKALFKSGGTTALEKLILFRVLCQKMRAIR